jgi:hypothetical protein
MMLYNKLNWNLLKVKEKALIINNLLKDLKYYLIKH